MSINNKQKRVQKKNSRKAKKQAKKSGKNGPVFFELPNPFAKLSEEERKIVISEIASNSRNDLQSCIKRLNEAIRRYNPIAITAAISITQLTKPVKASGVDSSSNLKFLPSHLEFFQALILTVPVMELGREDPTQDIVQEAIDDLIKLFTAFSLSRYDNLLEANEAQRAALSIQERLRAATQFVRNWGVHSKVIEISKGLYQKFDPQFASRYGFGISEAISVFQALLSQFEFDINKNFKFLREIFAERSPELMWRKYTEAKGYDASASLEIEIKFGIKSLRHNEIMAFILNDHQRYFAALLKVDIRDIADRTKYSEGLIEEILCEFSLRLGDLQGTNTEFLFLDNPIWKKPIIRIGESFCNANPHTFFSHIKLCLEDRLRQIADKEVSAQRSEYLESEISKLMRERIPDAWVKRNFKWKEGTIQYENDLVVVIDSHLLIFECKSHKIHEAASRGAPKKIESTIDDIVTDSAVQSWRLKNKLLNVISGVDNDKQFDSLLPKPIREIHKIIRVSLTLDDLILTSADYADLVAAGWIPSQFKPCPNISVADFQLLIDVLENPIHLIHYFERRSEISENSIMQGDEMDFLGMYLQTLLNYDNIPLLDYGKININGMSNSVLKYFESADAGVLLNKPSPLISKLFEGIINQLATRKSPRWTEIGCLLCGFLPSDQIRIEKRIKGLAKAVRKTWKNQAHKNSLCYVPPKFGNKGFCYVVCTNETWQNRYSYAESAKNLVFETERVDVCVVVVKNIDNIDAAYESLLVAAKADFDFVKW